ncbi:MAG: glycosyltransferase family 39 protein, partial [candidate division Zixibacteria bacterium]|nr:glycosyltransferase family 39 protein [candidate division Zixibacteria bacterium]
MPKAAKLMIVMLLATHVALLILFVHNRFIDGDEGFYLAAAWEVASGETPYLDYCYPQMPLLPYIYSTISDYGFDTLYYARYMSILAAVLTSCLMILMLRRQNGSDVSKVVSFMLYALSGLILAWHPTAKTYPWTNFLLLTGLFSIFRFARSQGYAWALLSGIAFGLAANIRLTLLPLILPVMIFIIANADKRRLRHLAVCLAGVVVASALSISLFTRDPQSFLFNNIGFHLIRYPGISFWQAILERLLVLGKLAINPQIIVIVFLLAASFLSLCRDQAAISFRSLFRSRDQFVFLMLGLILLIHILPNPIHQQYFTQAVPFAILLVPKGLDYLARRQSRFPGIPRLMKIACVIYVLGLIPYFAIFLGAIRERDSSHRIENVKALCNRIASDDIDGPLYSEWPVIPVLSARGSVGGLEFIAYDYGYP